MAKLLKKLIFKINDLITRKKWEAEKDGYRYITGDISDFHLESRRYGHDIFRMRCLVKYKQLPNGRWLIENVVSFINHNEMIESGIEIIKK